MNGYRRRDALHTGVQVLALLALLIAGNPATAGLGDDEASVHNDRNRLQGNLHSEDRHGYRLYAITQPDGTVVREFARPGGKVFGIAWDSPVHPDLQPLLGPYLPAAPMTYLQQPRVRGAPIRIETPGLVLYESGHMRSFHGRAYLPALVPQGVRAGEIR